MRLEHQEESGSQGASASARLTQEQLSELLDTAIAKHGAAERRQEQQSQLMTVDDALEIARSLNIPEEHVLAAAQELQKRGSVDERKSLARMRRLAPFGVTAGLAGLLTVSMGLIGGIVKVPDAMGALLMTAAWLPPLFFGWRWKFAPVSQEEADRIELPPKPGVCRVCGAPAVTPQSTFCEQHRYKGPTGGA